MPALLPEGSGFGDRWVFRPREHDDPIPVKPTTATGLAGSCASLMPVDDIVEAEKAAAAVWFRRTAASAAAVASGDRPRREPPLSRLGHW
jgi:hypothetical protein